MPLVNLAKWDYGIIGIIGIIGILEFLRFKIFVILIGSGKIWGYGAGFCPDLCFFLSTLSGARKNNFWSELVVCEQLKNA